MTRRLSTWFVFLLILISAAVSRAFSIPAGVQWTFEGTVHVTGDLSGCCAPELSDGEHVTGSLSMLHPPPGLSGPEVATATVQIPGGGSLSFSGVQPGDIIIGLDGAPGSPDELELAMLPPDVWSPRGQLETILGLPPSLFIENDPSLGFLLLDSDGTAWSGINPRTGDIFPDAPPDISLFETAQLESSFRIVNNTLLVASGSLLVQIDRFVPEPNVSWLAVASLAALVVARCSAARESNSGVPSAIRTHGLLP